MTAKELVLGGYQNFADGDLSSLARIYHPQCKITVNGNHKLSETYIGFQEFTEKFLSKLNETWPGFDLEIQKVVSDETDVCVFVKITAEGLSTESMHHFVVQHGLEVEFNIYDDSQRMAEATR